MTEGTGMPSLLKVRQDVAIYSVPAEGLCSQVYPPTEGEENHPHVLSCGFDLGHTRCCPGYLHMYLGPGARLEGFPPSRLLSHLSRRDKLGRLSPS